jgi:predicted secreted protein
MRIAISTLVWTALLMISAGTARAADAPPAAPAPVKAGPEKAEIAVGEIFQITLPCTKGTGYKWEIASVDRAIAAPAGAVVFRASADDAGKLGAGGTCSVWIQGVKPGRTEAVLVYRRPWEKKAPAKTFTARITVLPKK